MIMYREASPVKMSLSRDSLGHQSSSEESVGSNEHRKRNEEGPPYIRSHSSSVTEIEKK